MSHTRRLAFVCGLCLLGACKADIPDGTFACKVDADCPAHHVCRNETPDGDRYCFASDRTHSATSGSGGTDGSDAAGRDGGATARKDGGLGGGGHAGGSSAGQGGSNGAGVDAGVPARERLNGFATLGERRSGNGITLYSDGFELGERRCSADGKLCVQGELYP